MIRIIEEPAQNESAATYRGIIRHVQSDQEISFNDWSDVESFIQQFVPIQQMSQLNEKTSAPADPGGEK